MPLFSVFLFGCCHLLFQATLSRLGVRVCVRVLWVEIITEWKLSYLIHHIRQIHVYKCLSTKDQYEWEWLENIHIVIKCVY